MNKPSVAKSPLGRALGRDEVLSVLRAHKPELARQFGVETLALFGSTSRNDARPDSDIDILVTYNKPPSLFDEIFPTEEYLENVLGRKVDLGEEQDLDPRVKPYVDKDKVYV